MCRAHGASILLIIETTHSQLVPSSEIGEEWGMSQTNLVRDNIPITGVGQVVLTQKIYPYIIITIKL